MIDWLICFLTELWLYKFLAWTLTRTNQTLEMFGWELIFVFFNYQHTGNKSVFPWKTNECAMQFGQKMYLYIFGDATLFKKAAERMEDQLCVTFNVVENTFLYQKLRVGYDCKSKESDFVKKIFFKFLDRTDVTHCPSKFKYRVIKLQRSSTPKIFFQILKKYVSFFQYTIYVGMSNPWIIDRVRI